MSDATKVICVRDSLFDWILYSRGQNCFSSINMHSIVRKRAWKNKSKESKQAFSSMMSEKSKNAYKNKTKKEKKNVAKTLSKTMKKYWKTVTDEKRKIHIDKMAKGMEKAWAESDENFGTLIALNEHTKKIRDSFDIIPTKRVNDYSGVVTMSDMSSL